MPTRKKQMVIGVFETRERAERVIDELKAAGFDGDKIGMVHRNADGELEKSGAADDNYAGEGAAIGAVAGGGALALGSLGVSFGVIPVIGPILAVGPIAAALISAAGGAAAGGIAGALIGWGIPEEDAEYYENEVKSGRYLVTVDAGNRSAEARAIMNRQGGFDRAGWCAVRADRANTLAEGRFRDESGRVIQLQEEQLRANKERVNTGEVEVRKEVHTEHKRLDVPVEREEVVIERRPAGGRATGDMKAEEIRIPVKEERVRVTKEPVVKEEVTVGKRKVRDTKTVTGEVKKEELVVDQKGGARVRQTSKPGKR
jgi:uncharacterized protein (TIGR02271 family)